MKKSKKSQKTDASSGYSKEIEAKRVRINSYRDVNQPRPFLKGKMMTYIFLVLFPPYALYRIWYRDFGFIRTEKTILTMVSILYIVYFIKLLVN